jgi:predicted transcriptional regulator
MFHDKVSMRYRSRTDIVSQMLEAANGGATKTRIMYSAFLSYEQLKEYLSMLSGNGLLEHDEKSRMYKTTPKGNEFLEIYSRIGSSIQPATVRTSVTS